MKAMFIACILLVTLGLSLEATHHHLDAKLAPAKHCSVCLGAHVALPSAGTSPVISQATVPAVQVAGEAAGHTPFHSFHLYNRPPPPQA